MSHDSKSVTAYTLQMRSPSLTLPWLVRLRWVAVLGQLSAILLAVFGLGMELPLSSMVGVILVAALSNLWLSYRRVTSSRQLALLLGLDTILLTLLLGLSGGPLNPFSSLYLVHIALAAVTLGSRATWRIGALSMVGYAALFLLPQEGAHLHHQGTLYNHLYGMWLSFALTTITIAYFVARLSAELGESEAKLSLARERAARSERLVSLSTLAAGAAHELGSPLSTIAVAAKELQRLAARLPQGEAVQEEAALIREEIERCRSILARLRGYAGESEGAAPEPISLSALEEELRSMLGPKEAARLVYLIKEEANLWLPRKVLLQALVNLLRNALEASAAPVTLSVFWEARHICFEVTDQGAGMPPETLARVGEPFFTTKPPGQGMGLGIFLTRSIAEQLGGELTIESSLGTGTTALLRLPQPTQRSHEHTT